MNVRKGKVLKKVRKGKSPLKFVDEDEEIQHEPKPQDEGEDDDFKHAIRMSLDSFQVERQVPVGGRRIPLTEEASTGPFTQPQDDISEKVIQDASSPVDSTNVPEKGTDSERTSSGIGTEVLKINKQRCKEVSLTVALEEKTAEHDEGQARLDPGRTPESRPPPDVEKMEEDQAGSDPGKSLVALAGPNPEPMHEDFMATVYLNVYESLKLLADEHVILEDPLNEPGKPNVEAEVVSMVTVPIYQAYTSVPPMSTSVIEISYPKLSLSPAHSPIVTATPITTTTTTLALPPPPPT
ncbi:hypothetical protein Tco_1242782 [Tanacetum coccineum]